MEKKLQRNEQEKMLAGVCAGLADYFDIDVTWVRIAFVVAVLAGFSGLLIYVILWIVLPAKPYAPNYGQFNADYKVYDGKSELNPNQPTPFPPVKKSGNGRVIAGLIFILFGAFFLLNEFNIIPYWFDFGKLWPFVFIIPGILMIAKAGAKERKEDWRNKQDWNSPPTPASTSTKTEETIMITNEKTNDTNENKPNADKPANT